MRIEYYTIDGNCISHNEIRQAVDEHRALLIWSHDNWYNSAGLAIYHSTDEAEAAFIKYNTRGECYSMSEETWTEWPTLAEAIRATAGTLKVN